MSIVVSFQEKMQRLEPIKVAKPNDIGKFVIEMTCMYKAGVNSRCPKVVRNAKILFRNAAIKNGESLSQYQNTPTCDDSNDFHQR